MASPEADHPTAPRRARGAAAAALALGGLLLFLWPFVRTPSLGIGASYLHLVVSWALVVGGLALLGRALGRSPGPGDRGA